MYTFAGLFFVYAYCLDNFLGDWLTYAYSELADFADYLGFWQLANTIHSLGYQSTHDGGMYLTAVIMSLISCSILGQNFLDEIDSRSPNT